MLTRARIDGFRGLADVDVPLRPLTALIGQNDTGKSSFLHALNYLVGIPNVELSLPDVRRMSESQTVSVEGWFSSGGSYEKIYSKKDGGSATDKGEPVAHLYAGKVGIFLLPASGVSGRRAIQKQR